MYICLCGFTQIYCLATISCTVKKMPTPNLFSIAATFTFYFDFIIPSEEAEGKRLLFSEI